MNNDLIIKRAFSLEFLCEKEIDFLFNDLPTSELILTIENISASKTLRRFPAEGIQNVRLEPLYNK